ncbi:hypothetical protein [Olivibacter ginsenosidimutans]
MKRSILVLALAVLLVSTAFQKASAQSGAPYNNAFGLFLDLGNGGTYVGPHVKHFFSANDAGQAMVLFGNSITIVGVEYSYNKAIPNAGGLLWNIGVGPQAYFGDGETDFGLRPQAGLEFKVPQAPIAVGFDWRPSWILTHGSNFEAGRFGLTFKYCF